LREVFRGRLWTARPATVAAVRDDLVAVYLAPGTIFKVPANTSPDGNVVIDPDLSWRWKDEEELEEAVRLGLLTRQAADGIRAEGERVIARLEARNPPFCDGWERWRPDPAWPIPQLPVGWDVTP